MTKTLLKLYKEDCVPCATLENFLNIQTIPHESVDIMKNTDLAVKYGIMSVPVTILLNENGEEVDRANGFNPEKLNELISQL